MSTFRQNTFDEVEIDTDGNEYVDCVFNKCKLIYQGGPIPVMNGCQFNDTGWFFDDAAGRTVSLIKEYAENVDPQLVQALFGN